MANSPTKESVLNALKGIKAPGGGDLVSAGILSEIVIAKDKVYFALSVPQSQASACEPVRKAAEDAVKALPGVANAIVTLTADAKEGGAAAPQAGAGGIGGVKYIIAVASGKGGVGKSTTAVNLALGFQQNGLRVGVLDADIYGPSLPRLLAIKDRPELIGDSVLKPVEKYGLEVMSMGFLVDEETPMIWRGPMVISAITQMLKDVAWGELDIMVVDMPPGTGDAGSERMVKEAGWWCVLIVYGWRTSLISTRCSVKTVQGVCMLLGIIEIYMSHLSLSDVYAVSRLAETSTYCSLGTPFPCAHRVPIWY